MWIADTAEKGGVVNNKTALPWDPAKIHQMTKFYQKMTMRRIFYFNFPFNFNF